MRGFEQLMIGIDFFRKLRNELTGLNATMSSLDDAHLMEMAH
jgi:hypothetical protein